MVEMIFDRGSNVVTGVASTWQSELARSIVYDASIATDAPLVELAEGSSGLSAINRRLEQFAKARNAAPRTRRVLLIDPQNLPASLANLKSRGEDTLTYILQDYGASTKRLTPDDLRLQRAAEIADICPKWIVVTVGFDCLPGEPAPRADAYKDHVVWRVSETAWNVMRPKPSGIFLELRHGDRAFAFNGSPRTGVFDLSEEKELAHG